MSSGKCWCCGLGDIRSATLCGHCSDAGCNRFDEYCEAARMQMNLGGE